MELKMIENKEKNGIELYFESKPEREVLDLLRENNFRWHNSKKCWYAKDREETRKIAESLGKIKIEEMKIEPKNKKNGNKDGNNIGDIFVYSWGYEQTNVDYYQVVELKGEHTLVLKEIVCKEVEGSTIANGMACDVMPVKDGFKKDGETITKRPDKNGYINMPCGFAVKWDGRPDYCSWYY